jgi:hypothetical protein
MVDTLVPQENWIFRGARAQTLHNGQTLSPGSRGARLAFASDMFHVSPTAVLSLVLLLSCASIQDEYMASVIDEQGRVLEQGRTSAGLVISAQEVPRLASSHFGMVEVTFQNASSEWRRIDRLQLDFGAQVRETGGVSLPEQEQLAAWYLATLQRNDVRETNDAAALAGLYLLGETVSAIGAVTHENKMVAGGEALAGTAEAIAGVREYQDQIEHAERVRALPSTYLLSLPFSIPPGLFAKKWVVLNTQGRRTPCVRATVLEYELQDRSRERVLLRFRKQGDDSEWQRNACRPPRVARGAD